MKIEKRRALIVVDYQNDFVTGSMGFEKALALEQPILHKIQKAKQEGVEVLFTLDQHPPARWQNPREKELPVVHCLKNTEGCALYGAVASCCDRHTLTFEKQTFGSLSLAKYLEEQQFLRMEFVGIATHLCVLSNIVLAQAACPQARIRVQTDCVASPHEKEHLRALTVMRQLHVEVLDPREETMDGKPSTKEH